MRRMHSRAEHRIVYCEGSERVKEEEEKDINSTVHVYILICISGAAWMVRQVVALSYSSVFYHRYVACWCSVGICLWVKFVLCEDSD